MFKKSIVLASPAMVFLVGMFLLPAAIFLSYSVLTQSNGDVGQPMTAGNFIRLASNPLYSSVLLVTVRVSLITTVVAAILAFPCAMVIVRGAPRMGQITMLILIAPLVVSVVVRTYGWQLILANGNNGLLNWLLSLVGAGPAAVRVLYTETAVVIGSVHVFLPLFVLPLSSALVRIPASLEEAACTLGAPNWRVFMRVTFPLCLPGFVAGCSLVFALTFGSFVTPVLLGGNRALMLGTLLEQQVMASYDWPFASAIAVVMVVVIFAVNIALNWLADRRLTVSGARP